LYLTIVRAECRGLRSIRMFTPAPGSEVRSRTRWLLRLNGSK
jgi:hypothetical protein